MAAAGAIKTFYGVLLSIMKEGPKLGFDGRYQRLDSSIRHAFDLPAMTRLMVGPEWQTFPPDLQRRLIEAFSQFSIATYASRFDAFSGERFLVDPKAVSSNRNIIVRTQLIESDGDAVTLDYLMHEDGGAWRILDVYLSGTVSELAMRRSEFTSVLRRSGPEALMERMRRRVDEMRTAGGTAPRS